MNFMEIRSFYGELAKENAIGESLAKRILGISSEAELQKLIQDEILPLAKKMGYNFSEKDLLEYEKMVAQKLSPEDLLDVSGGASLKSALLSGGIFSLAMLGFGAISPVQADAMVPKVAVESATGGVVAGARNNAVNTVEAQVQAAIKPELKGKVSQGDLIQPLMRIISVSNTTAEQKEAAINLLLNLVSDDKKEDLKTSIETIKSTLPADPTLTEDVAKETLEEVSIKTSTNAELAVELEKFLKLSDKEAFLKKLNFYRNYVSTYNKEKERGHTTLSEETFNVYKADLSTTKKHLFTIYSLYRIALDEGILRVESSGLLSKISSYFSSGKNSEGYTFKDYQNICSLFDNLIEDTNLKSDSSLLTECSERGINFDNVTAESIQAAIKALCGKAAPSGGLDSDKEMVITDTEMLVEEAKDSQEVKLSQTDYGYLLDAWNGAEALVYKLTGVTENFRFLNPTNRPTLVKKDGEKYFRWKYNEDSGEGFAEFMRILFPCSDGGRIVVDSNVPNVPVFSRDCQPTAKLMAQIAAMLYKYRTATADEKKIIAQEIKDVLSVVDKLVKENKFDVKIIGDNAVQDLEKQLMECVSVVKDHATDFAEAIKQKEIDIAAKKLEQQKKQILAATKEINRIEEQKGSLDNVQEKNLEELRARKKMLQESVDKSNPESAGENATKATLEKLTNIPDDPNKWTENDFKHIKYILYTAALYTKEKKENPLKTTVDSIVNPFKNSNGIVDSYSKYVKLKNRQLLSKFCDENFDGMFTSSTGTAFSSMANLHKANTMLRLLTSAFFAIDNQEYEGEEYDEATPDKFAPKYFVEKMLMNFCIEHFNVEPGKPNPLELFYNEAKSLIKHNPTAESLTQTKQSGERIENTLKLLNKLEVSELSPYTSGTAQNGDTYPIGPVKDGKVPFMSDTFPDCADIAIRHVVNLLGYSVNKNWNVFFGGLLGEDGQLTGAAIKQLDARLDAFKSAASGHTQFEFLPLKDRLQLFFYHQSKVGVDATDKITRTLWEYAICNMNAPADTTTNMNNEGYYYLRYVEGNYELKSGYVNSLKLIYNIAKALGIESDNLNAAKAAIDALEEKTREENPDDLEEAFNAAVQQTYSLINPRAEISDCGVSLDTYELQNQPGFKDVFGIANINIKIDDDQSDFVVDISTGHSKIVHNPRKPLKVDANELKSDIDRLLGKNTASNIAGKTILNKFHMLFGDFLSAAESFWTKTGCFTENDPQHYKEFQALRFLKVVQGEENNIDRIKNELRNNPHITGARTKIKNATTNSEQPLPLFIVNNYRLIRRILFGHLDAHTLQSDKNKESLKSKIDFLTSFEGYEKVEENGFTFVISDGKASLCLYDGKEKEVKIPEKVEGFPVTKIDEYCFLNDQTIEKVTIPSTVENICESAFYNCLDLKSIVFDGNSKLKEIGVCAIDGCRELNSITIPESVERIEVSAFACCQKLENIDFENREKPIFIELDAFYSCPFSNIDFPHNVEFGNSRLRSAKNLKTITFTGPGEIKKETILKFLPYGRAGNFFKHNIEKLFYGQDSMKIDDKLTIDLWGGYLREDGTLDLSQFDVATFKKFNFARNNCVKRVIWPQGINAIPEEMFINCGSLEEVTIPNTVNEVGKSAFYRCENLAKITFEAGRAKNLSIDSSIFGLNYMLTEVAIVDNMTLCKGAFNGMDLEKIVIDADTENVQFEGYCFGYGDVSEDLRIYVRNDAMKEKITKNQRLNVKPENVIVGLPQGNE